MLHPSFADPTQPYVSPPTPAGHLRAAGLEIDLLDLNVEAARWLLSPARLSILADCMERRWLELNEQDSLSFEDQRQYLRLAESRPRVALAAESAPGIVETLVSREHSLDLPSYERARRHADAALEGVTAHHHPFRCSFNHAAHSVVPWSFDLLEERAQRGGPLDELNALIFGSAEPTGLGEDGFPCFDPAELGFVGLSVAFPSQIPEAWRLARLLRRLAPDAFLALRGPAIHQVVVHLEDPMRERLLDLVDGVGLFEGEETLTQLLPLLPAWRESRDGRAFAAVPNLLLRDPDGGPPRLGPRHVLDLRKVATPDPTGLDLDRSLAPSRTLLYAPTRGCYGSQCSFCYHGLSETATGSHREVPPERAAADLAQLSEEHGVTDLHVSCDVISHAHAVRLAQAMVDRGLELRWSSDLRSRSTSPGNAAKLER